MPRLGESRRDRFLRLMQMRLGRTLEDLRLVSQLASKNYENTPEEALEVMTHLDRAVRQVATAFEVDYATRIGPPPPLVRNEIAIARALEQLTHKDGPDIEQAIGILRQALSRGF